MKAKTQNFKNHTQDNWNRAGIIRCCLTLCTNKTGDATSLRIYSTLDYRVC